MLRKEPAVGPHGLCLTYEEGETADGSGTKTTKITKFTKKIHIDKIHIWSFS
jgi:hypothetical protein